MTAIYFPEGLSASDIIPRLLERGIVVAGGLHKDIKDKYFRIGHMGITATDTTNRKDLEQVKSALSTVLSERQELIVSFMIPIKSLRLQNAKA